MSTEGFIIKNLPFQGDKPDIIVPFKVAEYSPVLNAYYEKYGSDRKTININTHGFRAYTTTLAAVKYMEIASDAKEQDTKMTKLKIAQLICSKIDTFLSTEELQLFRSIEKICQESDHLCNAFLLVLAAELDYLNMSAEFTKTHAVIALKMPNCYEAEDCGYTIDKLPMFAFDNSPVPVVNLINDPAIDTAINEPKSILKPERKTKQVKFTKKNQIKEVVKFGRSAFDPEISDDADEESEESEESEEQEESSDSDSEEGSGSTKQKKTDSSSDSDSD